MSPMDESEEQAIDHLLGELGIHLPATEVALDGEDSEPMSCQDPDQPVQLEELRGWWWMPS